MHKTSVLKAIVLHLSTLRVSIISHACTNAMSNQLRCFINCHMWHLCHKLVTNYCWHHPCIYVLHFHIWWLGILRNILKTLGLFIERRGWSVVNLMSFTLFHDLHILHLHHMCTIVVFECLKYVGEYVLKPYVSFYLCTCCCHLIFVYWFFCLPISSFSTTKFLRCLYSPC